MLLGQRCFRPILLQLCIVNRELYQLIFPVRTWWVKEFAVGEVSFFLSKREIAANFMALGYQYGLSISSWLVGGNKTNSHVAFESFDLGMITAAFFSIASYHENVQTLYLSAHTDSRYDPT